MTPLALASTDASSAPNQVAAELTPVDIIVGRGSGPSQHAGNIRFREITQARKVEYTATDCSGVKHEIALQILKEIQQCNGRFLCSVENAETWTLASRHVALETIKQELDVAELPVVESDQPADPTPDYFDSRNSNEQYAVSHRGAVTTGIPLSNHSSSDWYLGSHSGGCERNHLLVPNDASERSHLLAQHWQQKNCIVEPLSSSTSPRRTTSIGIATKHANDCFCRTKMSTLDGHLYSGNGDSSTSTGTSASQAHLCASPQDRSLAASVQALLARSREEPN